MRKWIAVGVGVVLLGALALWFFLGRGAKAPPTSALSTATADRRDLEVTAEAAGLVEPVRVVEVKSKASGEVLRVLVETGDRVEQGALLAEIDPRDVQSSLEQAQADLQSARVTAQVTEAHRVRMETLKASATVTQQEYESAVQGAAAARAAVVRNETSVRLARERRGDVTIRAPISGTVLSRSVEEGQIIASATSNVSGGTALFQMADLSEMQVRAKVDESDIGSISVGQQARVTVEAHPGKTFAGRVAKVEPQAVVEQNITLFPVLVRLDNKQGLLRPGMNGEVEVEIARRSEVITVPSTAVVAARDAASAAQALGLQPDAVRGLLRGGGRGARAESGSEGGDQASGADGAGTGVQGTPGAGPNLPAAQGKSGRSGTVPAQAAGALSDADPPDVCRALREQIRAAGGVDGLSEEQRAQAQACREQRASGGAGVQPGQDAAGRRGLVFVQTPTGPEPRAVTLGLSDWENTEVIEGLAEGEQVVLVSVVQMKNQQQQSSERMRQRMGGGLVPGAGGGGGRGGRGR